jgi:periplasmic protein TonB
MKKKLSIFILAVTLLGVQACVSDREKQASNETPAVKASLTLAEKRANLETQRVAQMEKRLAYLEACVKASPTYTSKGGKLVYYKAETNPAFIGGEKALTEYLHNNLKYPKVAEEQGLEGTVFVDFVVLADGSVKEVEVMNEPDYVTDQQFIDEAVRVIINMPNWTPGQQRGKAVDVKFSVPVTFQII